MFDFLWGRYGVAAVPRSCAAQRVSFLKSAAGVVAASIREITGPSGNEVTGCRRPMRCASMDAARVPGKFFLEDLLPAKSLEAV
jgi:hypothetical protein